MPQQAFSSSRLQGTETLFLGLWARSPETHPLHMYVCFIPTLQTLPGFLPEIFLIWGFQKPNFALTCFSLCLFFH